MFVWKFTIRHSFEKHTNKSKIKSKCFEVVKYVNKIYIVISIEKYLFHLPKTSSYLVKSHT